MASALPTAATCTQSESRAPAPSPTTSTIHCETESSGGSLEGSAATSSETADSIDLLGTTDHA